MRTTSTKTLYEYWNNLRGSRSTPDRRDIDPTKIRQALANTFILETEDESDFTFRLAGSHLCTAYCRELKSRSFAQLWDKRDRDAIDTLVRAVTDDHAAALVTFQGTNAVGTKVSFELILLPLRHNGSTRSRILGGMTALDEPYWLGVQPIVEQRVTGLRLIWPDDTSLNDISGEMPTPMAANGGFETALTPMAMPATVNGRSARRYGHLAVIDGGRT